MFQKYHVILNKNLQVKMRFVYKLMLLLVFVFAQRHTLFAQRGKFDTIRTGAIIFGKDTFSHQWVPEVVIRERAPRWLTQQRRQSQRDREAYNRLRYNVYKTYPYAVAASFILKDVDSVLNSLYSKEAKSQYKNYKENELNKRFKHELEDMSVSQGQVLVKLIARQTGKPCYEIVKQLKGGFNATIFQGMALIFDNNLRNTYDAQGDDAAIESIVLEIEAQGHFETIH